MMGQKITKNDFMEDQNSMTEKRNKAKNKNMADGMHTADAGRAADGRCAAKDGRAAKGERAAKEEHITEQQFAEMAEKALRREVGEADVSIQKVRKNNGVMLTGLSIFGNGRNVSPTIYLECYYEQYLDGEPLEEVVEEILTCYREHDPQIDFDTDFFLDYRLAREQIAYRLISREKNEKLLEEIPYIPYLDLAITFFCKIEHEELGSGIIQIRNEHLRIWDITKEQLYDDAKRNMRTLYPEMICTMQELLADVEKEQEVPEEMSAEIKKAGEMPLYVVTNTYKSHGAAASLYEGVLEGLAEHMKSSLAVLPSSVHEMIVLPVKSEAEALSMREMVHEINRTRVEPEEVLSDTVYYYGRDTHILAVAAE
ncbi:MAG: DUF5688 family protein [Clostridium sp.]|nr:DUF5688 family protein [Clostridium sp.]